MVYTFHSLRQNEEKRVGYILILFCKDQFYLVGGESSVPHALEIGLDLQNRELPYSRDSPIFKVCLPI